MTFPDIQIPQLPYIITEGLYQDEDPEEEDFKIISMLCNQRGKEYPLICNNDTDDYITINANQIIGQIDTDIGKDEFHGLHQIWNHQDQEDDSEEVKSGSGYFMATKLSKARVIVQH